jgi:hypothetical protein
MAIVGDLRNVSVKLTPSYRILKESGRHTDLQLKQFIAVPKAELMHKVSAREYDTDVLSSPVHNYMSVRAILWTICISMIQGRGQTDVDQLCSIRIHAIDPAGSHSKVISRNVVKAGNQYGRMIQSALIQFKCLGFHELAPISAALEKDGSRLACAIVSLYTSVPVIAILAFMFVKELKTVFTHQFLLLRCLQTLGGIFDG